MNAKGIVSFFLSTTMVFAGPADETPINHSLKVDSLKTHLLIALDSYESARDAYEKRGQSALIEEMPELTKDDQSFLRSKVGNLKPLPKVTLEGEDTLATSAEIKAKVVSLEKGVTLNVKGTVIEMELGGSIRTAFAEMESALKPKSAWLNFSWLNDAYAADSTIVTLSIVAILAAAFLGGKSYSNYKDEKASREKDLLPEDASEEQLDTYRKTHGLQADGSRGFGFLGGAGRAASRFWSSASTKDKKESVNFYGSGTWGASIADSIRKLGPNSLMMTRPPADLLKQCAGFGTLSETDRHKVWIAFFDSLSMAESGHNPNVRFVESFGVTSRGMLQISWASARGHGGTCAGATSINLHDPNFNLGCGVKIMENQLRKRGTLFTDSFYYWSVLSPAKNPSGFKRLSARLNYLKAIPDRWPAGCQVSAK